MTTKTIYAVMPDRQYFESFDDATNYISGSMGGEYTTRRFNLFGNETRHDEYAIKWTFNAMHDTLEMDILKADLYIES